MSYRTPTAIASAAFCLALVALPGAQAAEGFQIRYNLAGSIGGEMFAAPDHAGFVGGVSATHVDVKKVTGPDGGDFNLALPGGTVPPPAPQGLLATTYPASTVKVLATGSLMQYNLGLGYITTASYGGGRMVYGLNLAYAKKKQYFQPNATTPPLTYSPVGLIFLTPAQRTQIAQGFDEGYKANVNAQASAEAGEVSGIGDTEVSAGWLYTTENLRVLTGLSVVLPTGKYDAAPGPDIGDGNFLTFRPSIQVTYLPTPKVALAGKLSFGFNGKNHANNIRSGDWVGLEGAAGYMTRLGPVGVHMIHVQQYQDDVNNPYGPSRYQSTGAGLFWTTKIPVIDAFMTVQYMRNTSSRNAKDGTLTQLRLVKLF